jgi:hypothetical protein
MNKHYLTIERQFERLTSIATIILGNSITFIIALCVVIFWLTNKMFYKQNIDDSIRDLIHGVTFLNLLFKNHSIDFRPFYI